MNLYGNSADEVKGQSFDQSLNTIDNVNFNSVTTVVPIPGGNPFDQLLNTFNSPTFNQLTLTTKTTPFGQDLSETQNVNFNGLTLTDKTTPFGQDLSETQNVTFNELTLTDKTTPFGQDLNPTQNVTFNELSLVNKSTPFGQNLSETQNVNFNGLTLTDKTTPFGQDLSSTQHVTFNQLTITDKSTPFGQDLSSTQNVTFNELTLTDKTTPFGQDLNPTQNVTFNELSLVNKATPFGQDLSSIQTPEFNNVIIGNVPATNYTFPITRGNASDVLTSDGAGGSSFQPAAGGDTYELLKIEGDLPPAPTLNSLTWSYTVANYGTDAVTETAANNAKFPVSVQTRAVVSSQIFYPSDISVGGHVKCQMLMTGRTSANTIVGIAFINPAFQFQGGGVGFTQGCYFKNQGANFTKDGVALSGGSSFPSSGDILFEVKVIRTSATAWLIEIRYTTTLTGTPVPNILNISIANFGFNTPREFSPFRFSAGDWANTSNQINSIIIKEYESSGYVPTKIQYKQLVDPSNQRFSVTDENGTPIIQADSNQINLRRPFVSDFNVCAYASALSPAAMCSSFNLYRAYNLTTITQTTFQDMLIPVSNYYAKGVYTLPVRFWQDKDLIEFEISGIYTKAAQTLDLRIAILGDVDDQILLKLGMGLSAGTNLPFILKGSLLCTNRQGNADNRWAVFFKLETISDKFMEQSGEKAGVSNDTKTNKLLFQFRWVGAGASITPKQVNLRYSSFI